MKSHPHHVAIIGGGISGLATAFAIHEANQTSDHPIDCTIIERNQTWGGKIITNQVDGFVVEGGPDSFLTSKPWTFELCDKLGLTDQLIETKAENRQTFCYTKGKMRELPQGLIAFIPTRLTALISSGLISPLGIARMGWDWCIPGSPNVDQDESLASFFCRRLGTEAFDHLIEPLVAGIYAGNANNLSLKATFPRFHELETRYGSLIKGIRAQRTQHQQAQPNSSRPVSSMFATLKGGLSDLVNALVKHLDSQGTRLLKGRSVLELIPPSTPDHRYSLLLDNEETLLADEVVLATPSYIAATLLKPHNQEVAELLDQIPYCSTATISLGFPTKDVETFIRGFGFVIPRIEGKMMLAATWTSLKWPNRANSEHTLIRCYLGGQGREKFLEGNNTSLIQYVLDELQAMVGITASPIFTDIYRWDRAMPQYVCGHLARLSKIRTAMKAFQGLHLTGAAYEGLGIPDCIRDGTRVGQGIVQSLSE